ncbi:hypothetical protein QEP16_08540 [Achromobacter insolitus]|jgi:hypothetical protein|uniref:Uncharacterized protein n=1 Tax=Achromobacter insolitus TaxID=217204 RepID=A0A6S7F7A5_9BURK|nr:MULTISPECIES: hypothetical protein [Achromobacter]GLK92413.1 hypothetical protein GCM10008164_01490 [Achromobacter xylosoxidans]MDH3063352.1 hypothetical protein [Achromobacter insolitus]MDQ6211978.1 heme-binding protein [Achromobacter insolitus]MEB3098347.1 hypothetical protein [Achromobacter sp. D10]NGT15753.1 hypothetical protein [Achromobacter insolitus]
MQTTPLAAYWERDAAAQAVQLALPMLEAARGDPRVGDSGFLHIVIMNPLARPGACEFAGAILYEESIGDPEKWDADYGAYARGKARLSWRTGRSSHEVLALQPHLLHAKDTQVWGSVAIDGIVVAVSGANPWFDEALAAAIAHLFKAVVQGRQHQS